MTHPGVVIEVAAEQPYQVRLGHGVGSELAALVGDAQRVAVVRPAVLAERAEALTRGLRAEVLVIEVPDAEQAKTATVLADGWGRLAAAGFTRSDVVIGFGGGATTDLAGFLAATWLRGVRLITVPSTVLGMVDAAVGGKTGINLPAGKNLVGAFHEPSGVLCDLDLLTTLPPADLRAGLAEVIKCGFIADPAILELAERAPERLADPASDELAEAIGRGIAVKAATVSADLRERTSDGSQVGRELLNYGHTLGHAIERREQYRWRHGDAVAVGCVFVAELAHAAGRLDAATTERHRTVFAALGLPVSYPGAAWPELYQAMFLDKKTRGSTLRFVILDGLARAGILVGPDEELLLRAYHRISS